MLATESRFAGPDGLARMGAAVASLLVPQRLFTEPDRFGARVRTADLGDTRVIRATAAPLRAVRTGPSGDAEADGTLFVLLGRQAHGRLAHPGGHVPVDPDHLVVIPSAAPFDVVYADPLDVVFVALGPRRAARLHPGLATALRGFALPPSGRAVLGHAVDAVLGAAGTAGHADVPDLAAIVESALAVAIRPLTGELVADPAAALRTATQRLAARRLDDPDLNPRTLAASLHVAPSTLHRAFAPGQETVAGMVRRLRLDAIAAHLTDPAHAETTVAALAARYGFASASHLASAFRARYGTTPARYRAATARGSRLS